jgi:hypothetical protein
MTHDPTRDCEHGRLKGKCDVCDLQAEVERLKAAQPVPVKTYHDGKPWPVAPKPWVGLTDEEVKEIREQCDSIVTLHAIKAIEAKLKEKNHG